MKKSLNLLAVFIILGVALMSDIAFMSESVSASEPVVIRTLSADPLSRTYTFICKDDGSGLAGNGIRNWFIYPEDTNVNELTTSLPANQPLTYTFARNAYYDVTCNDPNPPGLNYTSLYRHSLHIDLRTQLGNPAVVPLSVAPNQITEQCIYNSSAAYTTSWFLSTYSATGGSGPTVRYSLNTTGNTLTFTPPFTPGLFDTHCLVHLTAAGTDIDIPNGVDFPASTSSAPYVADQYGIDASGNFAAFNSNTWNNLHNNAGTTPPPTTGSISLTTNPGGAAVTLNGNNVGTTSTGTSGTLTLPNVPAGSNTIVVSLAGYQTLTNSVSVSAGQTANLNLVMQPVSSGTAYTSMNNIPATCTGGTINSDSVNSGGGRIITCASGSNSLTVTVYNKPGDYQPSYFEMYKTSQTGSGATICLLTTCLSSNGFAISPNFPITTGSPTPTTGTISLTTTPGGASVALNNNNVGITSAGASGTLSIPNVPAGTNSVAVSLTGYQTSTNTVSVTAGQVATLNVILQASSTGTTYNSMNSIPATCTGGSISTDSVNSGGGRVISCASGSNSLTVTVYNKPGDYQPSYFEMYKTSQTGSGATICLLTTCLSSNGFAISPNFPIIIGSGSSTTGTISLTTTPGGASVTLNGNSAGTTTSGTSGTLSIPNVPAGSNSLTASLSGYQTYSNTAVSVIAGQTTNLNVQLQQTTTGTGSISLTTAPGGAAVLVNGNPAGTTDSSGLLLISNIVAGSATIRITKANYNQYQNTVNVVSGQTSSLYVPLLNTNPSNQPPQAPTWLEPPATGVYPNDFHLHTNNAVDAENDAILSSDFEIWDVASNSLVWASYKETVDPYHIHRTDGTFMGILAGQTQLAYNTQYQVRARFYEDAQFNNVSQWSAWRTFTTVAQTAPPPAGAPSWTPAPGYSVQLVAGNISAPVNVVVAPALYSSLPLSQQPLLYVTQLYGQIGVIMKDGSYRTYASNLLNYQAFGSIPGSGETGVDGLYVDPATGDLYASITSVDNTSSTGMFGNIWHFVTNANGDGYTSKTLVKGQIPVRPSHHVHTITKGPDGLMYVSVGDADQITPPKNWPQDPTTLNGKVLRMNWDGSMPADNPFPGTYTYALGFRNPFGMAFRPGTNELFVSNNGQDTDDGLYKTLPGSKFGWASNLTLGVWYGWPIEIAPTQVAFDTYNTFPTDTGNGGNNVYVVGSGSTYLAGPSPNSKRIFRTAINPDGSPGAQTAIVNYTGTGFGAPIGLAFAPDGMYFTDIYGDAGFTGVGVTKGNVYKVIYTGQVGPPPPPPPPPAYSATLASAAWYPQGLNQVWVCTAVGGSGSYTYDFTLGDGESLFGMSANNVYHTYASHGTYSASCTVHDTSNGQTTSASTSITL